MYCVHYLSTCMRAQGWCNHPAFVYVEVAAYYFGVFWTLLFHVCIQYAESVSESTPVSTHSVC